MLTVVGEATRLGAVIVELLAAVLSAVKKLNHGFVESCRIGGATETVKLTEADKLGTALIASESTKEFVPPEYSVVLVELREKVLSA